MLGCNSRNTDVQAAINIGIAGMTTMLTGSALALFSASKTSHFYAGVSPSRGPWKDVLQVPAPSRNPRVTLYYQGKMNANAILN
jgi:hypothetical protein